MYTGTLPGMDPEIVTVVVPSDPNVWDVLTAIGTVGAVVVALILGLLEQHRAAKRQKAELDRLERERNEAVKRQELAEQRDALREQESQARRVAIWTEPLFDPKLVDPRYAPFSIHVTNRSDFPIRMVALGWYRDEKWGDVTNPEMALQPNETVAWRMPVEESQPEGTKWSVMFWDSAGRTWLLFLDGKLHLYKDRDTD